MGRRVTVVPGDGIGPEVTEAAVAVLEATGVKLTFEKHVAGAGAESVHGTPLPIDTVESLRETGVGLKGPLVVEKGSPAVEVDGKTYATPNAAFRGVCDAFANVRPCRRFPGVPGRFADAPVDLVIVREVSEGIYVGRERDVGPGHAEATLVTTREGSERIARFAFELARDTGRKRVTAVHKANVLDRTDGLFLKTFQEVAAGYTSMGADDMMIDAAAARMVLAPESFDVIVAPNQYGDILSDEAAAVVGGLGLGPGGNFGERIAVFEACHGAAPDIAGRGVANPIALILSGAMLLDHIGEPGAGARVRNAVATFLERGEGLTPDLGGTGTTRGVQDGIVSAMGGR